MLGIIIELLFSLFIWPRKTSKTATVVVTVVILLLATVAVIKQSIFSH
jgi:hypothetical protein